MNHKKFLIFGYFLFIFVVCYGQTKDKPAYPVDTTYTIQRQYQKYKKYYSYLIPVKDETPKGVVEARDLVYATLENTPYGKRELHLDLFRPEKQGKYPVLILVHGGGWRAGNKSLQVPMAQMIAKDGFVTVAVEYQLGLEARYPAAIYNLKAAIRWLRANAEKYLIDPDHIAISGCSSGGHLAMLVGMTNGVEQFEGNMGNESYPSSVQAVIDIDGVVNFMAPISLNKERSDDSPDVQWLGGQFTEVPAIWKEASPIYWANEHSVPIVFFNSGYPRFHAGQDELIGMYKEWGIYYEVQKYDVRMHTFWLFHPYMDMTVKSMIDFMNKVLK